MKKILIEVLRFLAKCLVYPWVYLGLFMLYVLLAAFLLGHEFLAFTFGSTKDPRDGKAERY